MIEKILKPYFELHKKAFSFGVEHRDFVNILYTKSIIILDTGIKTSMLFIIIYLLFVLMIINKNNYLLLVLILFLSFDTFLFYGTHIFNNWKALK